jgi:glutamyl-tRNA synthetase
VRTALFNYLFAKGKGGTMILRIEDTDQTRFVHGAEEYIQEALDWCGIKLDESPWHGGKCAPYRQSERKPMYRQYAERLVEEGKAYYAFDTSEELDEMRKRLEAAKVQSPQYNAITRMQMKNSLTLPADEVKARLERGEPYVIRFKVPKKEEVRLHDLVRGWVMVHSHTIDDKVLMKSDGMPTYHLANVVDDYLMEITHVIRGEEWLPSAPLHVMLYQAFGWENVMPQFAHLPLLLKPSGEGKLSKRDGDQLGFPVFPMFWKDQETGDTASGYREKGFLPNSFINFLAFLGWNPGTEKEIFTMQELCEAFSIERVGKSGTKFDFEKAKWYNHQYIKAMPDAELAKFLLQEVQKAGLTLSQERAEKICALLKERVTFTNDFFNEGKYFFSRPATYDMEVAKKKWNAQAVEVFKDFNKELEKLSDYQATTIKAKLEEILTAKGMKIGMVLQALRLAVTGVGAGADLMQIMEVLGKEETTARIQQAIDKIPVSA